MCVAHTIFFTLVTMSHAFPSSPHPPRSVFSFSHLLNNETGAVLAEMPPDDEPTSLKFAGSSLVVVAESKEEIVQMLRNDIYGTMGVWDVDNVSVYACPFQFLLLAVV